MLPTRLSTRYPPTHHWLPTRESDEHAVGRAGTTARPSDPTAVDAVADADADAAADAGAATART
ncbi:hypothetical protein [Thalassiella azotivora]